MQRSPEKNAAPAHASRAASGRRDATGLALVEAESQRGRMLYVRDILELIRHEKSAWWVRKKFAPDLRHKVGRSPYWWETDALAWLQNQRAK